MHHGKSLTRKKKKGAESETAAEVETTNIQPGFVAAKGSVPVNSGKKRKLEEAENLNAITKRRKEIQIAIATNDSCSPSGLVWDGDNYSCAYDALFAILFNIWTTKPKKWEKNISRVQSISLYTSRWIPEISEGCGYS